MKRHELGVFVDTRLTARKLDIEKVDAFLSSHPHVEKLIIVLKLHIESSVKEWLAHFDEKISLEIMCVPVLFNGDGYSTALKELQERLFRFWHYNRIYLILEEEMLNYQKTAITANLYEIDSIPLNKICFYQHGSILPVKRHVLELIKDSDD